MRRKTTYEDFQVHRTPERLTHWRHDIEYSKRDRLCRGAADLVVYKLPAPVPSAAGKRIAFISDFHYSGSTEQLNVLQCLKTYLQTYQPELLLFGGDVCSDAESLCLIPGVLQELSSIVPRAFAVPGNWERGKSWIPVERWKKLFAQGGFDIGFNEFRTCGDIQIFCADDPAYGNPILPDCWDKDKVHVLLVHRPDTVIALVGQIFSHFIQPIQATLQFLRAIAPFSVLEHFTETLFSGSTISIMPLGHAFTQQVQAVQEFESTLAIPFSM